METKVRRRAAPEKQRREMEHLNTVGSKTNDRSAGAPDARWNAGGGGPPATPCRTTMNVGPTRSVKLCCALVHRRVALREKIRRQMDVRPGPGSASPKNGRGTSKPQAPPTSSPSTGPSARVRAGTAFPQIKSQHREESIGVPRKRGVRPKMPTNKTHRKRS